MPELAHHVARSEAARILGLEPNRLRYWDRIGLVKPSLREGRRTFYDFQDLISLEIAQRLVQKGQPATRIKSHIRSLQERLPKFDGQLATKRIYVFDDRVIVSNRRRLIDTHSGRLCLKFDVADFQKQVDSRLAKIESRTASEWFRRGLELQAEPRTQRQALDAFREAVKLDPQLADAYVNMGVLYYQQAKLIDAQRCFRMALRRSPYHTQACFELGNCLDELNCTEEALRWYEKSVEISPEFSDGYYNLATTAEKLGLWDRAVRAWRAFLQFDPRSSHAGTARGRIEVLEKHLEAAD